jgi:hypothetical protein
MQRVKFSTASVLLGVPETWLRELRRQGLLKDRRDPLGSALCLDPIDLLTAGVLKSMSRHGAGDAARPVARFLQSFSPKQLAERIEGGECYLISAHPSLAPRLATKEQAVINQSGATAMLMVFDLGLCWQRTLAALEQLESGTEPDAKQLAG